MEKTCLTSLVRKNLFLDCIFSLLYSEIIPIFFLLQSIISILQVKKLATK